MHEVSKPAESVIRTALAAYPDMEAVYSADMSLKQMRRTAIKGRNGDTLRDFVVLELIETAGFEESFDDAKAEAQRVIGNAIRELEGVLSAVEAMEQPADE